MSLELIVPDTYNFVIFGSDWEFYKIAYRDVIGVENIRYITPYIPNPIFRKLRNIHLSEIINSKISVPLKYIWNSIYFHDDFPTKRPLCFVVFYDWYVKNIGFIEFLRKKYPKSSIVTVFHDLIDVKRMAYTDAKLDIPYLKSLCDFVITYDFKEAQKYGLLYHAIPYSNKLSKQTFNDNLSSDVYFLGQAKNRYSDIIDLYYKLRDYDLKLKFILSGVPVENRIFKEGITYLDSAPISYEQNIEYISNTKCILEIIQHNSTGYTSRTLEAIAHNKLLLSNNPYLKRAPFYNPEYISIYRPHKELDSEFIDKIRESKPIKYENRETLSPIALLEFIVDHCIKRGLS